MNFQINLTRQKQKLIARIFMKYKTSVLEAYSEPSQTYLRGAFLQKQLTVNGHWRRSGVFIVNFIHISHLVLVFLLLTLNM